MFVWRALSGRATARPEAFSGAAGAGASGAGASASRPGAFLTVPAMERRGVRIAFTNRTGGTSSGVDASLNLSFLSHDDPETVKVNRALALSAVGASPDAWTSGKQVHETSVVHAGVDHRGSGAFDAASTIAGTDGLWTSSRGVALAVLTADCVPVVVADAHGRRVAALHAGWRGLTAGILERGVEALTGDGSDAAELSAFVGPAIGPCCYEVGDDVAAAARDALGESVVVKGDAKAHVDLWTGARIALARAGVRRTWLAGLCTKCEPHRFYSHRAGATGRQGAIAMLS